MSSLALGFAASSSTAGIITSFPNGGVLDSYGGNQASIVWLDVNGTSTAFPNPAVSSDLKSLTLYANQYGHASDTIWDFAFTTGGVISFNWQLNSGAVEPGNQVIGNYYVWDGGTTFDSQGTLGTLTGQDNSSSGSVTSVNIPDNYILEFRVQSSQDATKTPASLDITVVPEPATWISGLFLLGTVSFSFLKNRKDQFIKTN